MKLDSRKELTPVLYSNMPVKAVLFTVGPLSQCFKEHWHERMEILHIQSGKMTVTVRDKTFEAKEGDTVVVCPENTHMGMSGKEGVEYIVLMFDTAAYINSTSAVITLLEGLIRGNKRIEPLVSDKDVAQLIEKILLTSQKRSDAACVYIEGCVYMLLSVLFERYTSKDSVTVMQKRFSRVFDYISENLDRDLSTNLLCSTFGYDKSYFCRRFKADSGLTPSGYVRIMRLEKSKGLLSKGLSVSDAATLSGFSSYGYFERCFKAEYKMTPSEYVKLTAK